ncbi:MAG: asparagine synthase-related protein [Planctomycetota bacterium]
MVFGAGGPAQRGGLFGLVGVFHATGGWIAARDHMGICPLYMGSHPDGTVWFASEMKALVDDCERIELVEPGTLVRGGDVPTTSRRWYDQEWMHATPDWIGGPARIREKLIGAVEKRFMADVPWGVLLSGGVDSSIVASIAQRIATERGLGSVHTFSIGLEGSPDLEAAQSVAHFLGTHHHEYTFTLDEALAAVPSVSHHLESDQQVRTGVPTYLLAQRVKADGFKMVLSGEGADELFGGYLYFHAAPSREAFHEETVRKTLRLHQYDVMRANKAPMAFGLELRFPFLDRAVIDEAMSTDPADRMIDTSRPMRHLEKGLLREAFTDADRPWLPERVLWRQKEQFSDGVGYGWVDLLRDEGTRRVSAETMARREDLYPELTPANEEMVWMRELFEARFVMGKRSGRSALAMLGSGRSVACCTPEAIAWDPRWEAIAGDISGRGVVGVHGTPSGVAPTPEIC